MKAIVDDKIPYIYGSLERLGFEVQYLTGSRIGREDVRDVDLLVVRTRTRCDEALLSDSRVSMVVTATIGLDHLDTQWLSAQGIRWANCPGCNATSVAQYVRNCLLAMREDFAIDPAGLTVGIVGVGNVGRAVREALLPLGCKLLLNDPPLEEAQREVESSLDSSKVFESFRKFSKVLEVPLSFSSLSELAARCDVITLHTPLTTEGPHATRHLFDEARLRSLRRQPVLINTSRGEVVDNAALERALDEGFVSHAIIDTWEDEPHVRRSLLNKVYIGTPHVAGYSADGKANATRMTLETVSRWLGREDIAWDIHPAPLPPDFLASVPDDSAANALSLYDPRTDSQRLKQAPEQFEYLRGHYPLRRETME